MTVRIGILGMGFMGNCHFNAYRGVPNARVAAICDIEPERLKGEAGVAGNISGAEGKKDLTGIALYNRADDLLADQQIDVVDVTLPTYLHAEWTVKALAAGKHVVCEKPMALDARDARKMVQAAKKARRRLFVGHCIRFWPAYAFARDVIARRQYGKVLSAVFTRVSPTPGWSWKSWLLDPKLSGNAALDLHIHDVDFVLYAFGRPRSVFSRGVRSKRGSFEHIVTCYDYSQGPKVVSEGGWGYAGAFPFAMSFRVAMEKASLALHPDGKLGLYEHGRPATFPDLPPGDGYGLELKHFVDCIESGVASKIVTPESAAESVMVTQAEIKSAASGRPERCR